MSLETRKLTEAEAGVREAAAAAMAKAHRTPPTHSRRTDVTAKASHMHGSVRRAGGNPLHDYEYIHEYEYKYLLSETIHIMSKMFSDYSYSTHLII